MREYWTSLASLMGVLAFCQTLITSLFPPSLRYSALNFITRLSNYFSNYCYYDITEIDGVNTNELYNAVQLYLSSCASASNSTGRLSLTRSVNSSGITFGLAHNDTLYDSYNGVSVQWDHIVTQRNSNGFSWRPVPDEKRGFVMRIRKTTRPEIIPGYLDHIMEKATDIRRKFQDRFLYTNTRGGSMDPTRPGHPWEAVPFKHPSTFDTLAMDPARKAEIVSDLLEFAAGESFYRATGRAWKRGYLLYGPPGTGKSSMIAAMANLLNYDIYDLEVTEVGSNSELRKLLMKTTSKSIIVIEDIDCSVNLCGDRGQKIVGNSNNNNNNNGGQNGQRAQFGPGQEDGPGGGAGTGSVTLSGLLNFTDGLWSCCGSERIFVFTTNHVEKLDPALLRSGRMDMHVHMSYCTCESVWVLVRNYLGIGVEDISIQLKAEFKRVVEKARITPADVSEVLIRHRREKGKALSVLLEELKRRAKGGTGFGAAAEEVEEEKRELEMMQQHKVENGVDNVYSNGSLDDTNKKLK
ncbi:hypothetical protein vseg_016291 [Gypsophila vaccaria]